MSNDLANGKHAIVVVFPGVKAHPISTVYCKGRLNLYASPIWSHLSAICGEGDSSMSFSECLPPQI
jgi:hypothetical protein